MTLQQPWLSILIPVYNVADYLQECVESVMDQVDSGVEVILLDDVSTDSSAELAAQLQRRWPQQIRLMHHARNRGLSAARNTMLQAAQGTYVWFLDSDDKLLPGALAQLRQVVMSADIDLVLCDFQVWRSQTKLKHRLRGEAHRRTFAGASDVRQTSRSALLAGLLETGQLHAWSKIAKRSVWQGVTFPEGAYFEDAATMPRLALRAQSYWYCAKPWVAYRQRGGSILASMTLAKVQDLAAALTVFRCELDAEEVLRKNPSVIFALSHQAARHWLGAMKFWQRDPARKNEDAQNFWQLFLQQSLLSPDALLKAYLRKAWWARAWRLKRALQAFRRDV